MPLFCIVSRVLEFVYELEVTTLTVTALSSNKPVQNSLSLTQDIILIVVISFVNNICCVSQEIGPGKVFIR